MRSRRPCTPSSTETGTRPVRFSRVPRIDVLRSHSSRRPAVRSRGSPRHSETGSSATSTTSGASTTWSTSWPGRWCPPVSRCGSRRSNEWRRLCSWMPGVVGWVTSWPQWPGRRWMPPPGVAAARSSRSQTTVDATARPPCHCAAPSQWSSCRRRGTRSALPEQPPVRAGHAPDPSGVRRPLTGWSRLCGLPTGVDTASGTRAHHTALRGATGRVSATVRCPRASGRYPRRSPWRAGPSRSTVELSRTPRREESRAP